MNKVKIDEKENNKNISTKNNSRSYNSFLNSHDNIFLSNKNDSKEMINENKFINIDSNANLSKIKKNDLEKINKIIDELKETKHHVYKDGDGNIIKDIVTHILSKFLSKLYPKCEINYGSISLLISKDYYLKNNISNKSELKIEENINYFFKSRYEYKYSKILKFNKEFFQNCGKILINIYSKIKLENISKTGGLKLYRNKINEENLNVLTDYYNYCDENHLDPAEVEKTLAWKNFEKKYNIPPEFIFLFNIFQEINILDIDLEFASDIETEEDFSFLLYEAARMMYEIRRFSSKCRYVDIPLFRLSSSVYLTFRCVCPSGISAGRVMLGMLIWLVRLATFISSASFLASLFWLWVSACPSGRI